jgi:hypothetical protein
VRDVFRLARENAPAVIFIDEVDAIATKRFDAQTGADREVQRILLELLNQMDGFDITVNVKVEFFRWSARNHLLRFFLFARLSWPPIAPTRLTPRCYVPGVWTARLSSRCQTVDRSVSSSRSSPRR